MIDEILLEIAKERETQDFVLETLRQQLFNEGVEGFTYADSTIKIKQRKNQPTNRVTLRDTGEFYDSFQIEATDEAFIITSDSEKNGYDILSKYPEDKVILTMDEVVLEQIREYFEIRLAEKINEELFNILDI